MVAATPTAQEIFDLAVAGVLKQGEKSVNAVGECSYRGCNGLKCAAGFLLTDAEAIELEGDYIDKLDSDHALYKHVYMIRCLQYVHDQHDVKEWPERFRFAAMRHNLSPAVIDQWEAEQAGGDS